MSERQCPLCASSRTRVFLSETGAPVHQNRLFHTDDEAKEVGRGDLVMTVCEACGFVFNAAFDPSKIEYGEGYDNSHIPSWRPHPSAPGTLEKRSS